METQDTDKERKQAQFEVDRQQVVLTEMKCPKCGAISAPNDLTDSNNEKICPVCKKPSSTKAWLISSMKHKFDDVPPDVPREYSPVILNMRVREFMEYMPNVECTGCGAKSVMATLDNAGNATLVCSACGKVNHADKPGENTLRFYGVPVRDILKAMNNKKFTPTATDDKKQTEITAVKPVKKTPDAASLIKTVCAELEAMLLEKNRKYGNSALEPVRLFSKADPVEAIKVRIDDKLSRLRNEQPDEDEDVAKDLMGYLVLLEAAKRMKEGAR